MRNKVWCMVLAGTMVLGGTGIYAADVAVSTKEDVVVQQDAVTYQQSDKVNKNKKGVVMLTTKYNQPVLGGSYSQTVKDKFNHLMAVKKAYFDKDCAELLKMAEADYKERTAEQLEYWNGYYYADEYAAKRMDDKVISMTIRNDVDTAGAHPDSTTTAVNFDAATGNVLAFRDIVTDEKKARAFVNDFILNDIKTSEHPEYYFEDYADAIDTILKDYTWYFSDEGIVIMSNEYIITPHAVGLVEFTIPYKDFPYLKTAYQKN